MLASFAHLGTKKNAWRMLAHLKKSWLSREILFTLLFGTGWLFTTCEMIFLRRISPEAAGITAALGLGLVYSMAQVYRLATAPNWNTWRTNFGFIVTAFLLGQSLMVSLLAAEASFTGIQLSALQREISGIGIMLLLLIQLSLRKEPFSNPLLDKVRLGLILAGVILSLAASISKVVWIIPLIFLVVLLEEGLGRWLFYQSRTISGTFNADLSSNM
jgi:DMSO reductase anchor subunit